MANYSSASVDILNAITNASTVDYQNAVPIVTSADQIASVGAIITNNPALMNQYMNSLMVMTVAKFFHDKMYENHFRMFKKGSTEGRTIESIFVELIQAKRYNENADASAEYSANQSKIEVQFLPMNSQVYYDVKINEIAARNAFNTPEGIGRLVEQQVNSLYKSANYDEEQATKYMIAIRAINGEFAVVAQLSSTPSVAAATLKEYSNNFEYMSTDYNFAGVHVSVEKPDQYLIMSSAYNAKQDVNVLATAFNMDKAEFLGHQLVVDGFGKLDTDRLYAMFGGNALYHAFTTAEKTALNKIDAVLVGREFLQIYDQLNIVKEKEVTADLSRIFRYHKWNTFATDIFENAALFTSETPSITSVDVSPATASVAQGASIQLTATVVNANFAPKKVVWESSNEDVATVDAYGRVTVKSTATDNQTATITATSVFDGTKSDTCTVTVS